MVATICNFVKIYKWAPKKDNIMTVTKGSGTVAQRYQTKVPIAPDKDNQ
jgi:hypothetical protein